MSYVLNECLKAFNWVTGGVFQLLVGTYRHLPFLKGGLEVLQRFLQVWMEEPQIKIPDHFKWYSAIIILICEEFQWYDMCPNSPWKMA